MKPDYPSAEELSEWQVEGKVQGATHMLVVWDDLQDEFQPVYVLADEGLKEVKECYRSNGFSIREVISL